MQDLLFRNPHSSSSVQSSTALLNLCVITEENILEVVIAQ
jgi:hypothetical protein